jgi:hypothetical protein
MDCVPLTAFYSVSDKNARLNLSPQVESFSIGAQFSMLNLRKGTLAPTARSEDCGQRG